MNYLWSLTDRFGKSRPYPTNNSKRQGFGRWMNIKAARHMYHPNCTPTFRHVLASLGSSCRIYI